MNDVNQLDFLSEALVTDVVDCFGERALRSVEKKLGQPLAEVFKETLMSESGFPRSPHNYNSTFALAHLHETALLGQFSYTVGYNAKSRQFKTTIQEPEGVKITATQDSLAAAVQQAHRHHHLLHVGYQHVPDES